MRVARYERAGGGAGWGLIEGERLFSAAGVPWDREGLRRTGEVGPVAETRLLAPVTPGKIVCVGLNYVAHVTENDPSRVVPEEPVLFMKPRSALIGPGEAIRIANPEHRTDYEAELALVIGTGGRNIPEIEALDHVFGYTCANDVSDRVLQKKDGQWIRAKGYDTYCPVGPWIETDLEIADIPVRSRLNGEDRQSQRTSSMIFSPAFLIAFVSRVMTLQPGDLLLTGTPEGVGPMAPGDIVEIEVGGIGILRNPVEAA